MIVLTLTVQDNPSDATGNPGLEEKQPEVSYADSPSEEHLGGYGDGWPVGKGQQQAMDPRAKGHEEDAVEVSSYIPQKPP